MNQRCELELIEAIHPRYLAANKVGKQQILDDFVPLLGMNRAMIDRCLKKARLSHIQYELYITNQGNLFKKT